jgi:hypothetical protein
MAGDLAFVGSLLVLHLVLGTTQNPNPPHLLALRPRAPRVETPPRRRAA